jgi:phosphatidylserine decarboxylase
LPRARPREIGISAYSTERWQLADGRSQGFRKSRGEEHGAFRRPNDLRPAHRGPARAQGQAGFDFVGFRHRTIVAARKRRGIHPPFCWRLWKLENAQPVLFTGRLSLGKAVPGRRAPIQDTAALRLPIHREGWPFVAFAVAINAAFLLWLGWWGLMLLPLTLWVVAFFRDPERQPPQGEGLIVSPADGVLLPLANAAPPAELGLPSAPRTRLSIFMNVFDIHVNRIPEGGTVQGLAYRPGKFFNASFDKASEHNERMAIRLGLVGGAELIVVQIAGLVARRIFCSLTDKQRVSRGERFGLIRFGSRLDVYLPAGASVSVQPGQRVRAGETVLATLY